MEVPKAESRLRQTLVETGFDFQKPNPALAWMAFKEFCRQPVKGADGYLCVGIGTINRGEPFRFDLARYLCISDDPHDLAMSTKRAARIGVDLLEMSGEGSQRPVCVGPDAR